jgi:molecular chaperone DnaK
LLGQFNLEGIPPAPRGMPQIEVKFDIDANGILNVSARDLGSGKEQKVKIEQSGGLTADEIERRRRDAEEHASEDKRKRELAEARNQADTLAWHIEKTLKENEGKFSEDDAKPVRAAVEKTRQVAKGEDTEAIKAAVRELEQAHTAMSKVLYQSATRAAGGPAEPHDGAKRPSGDDDTIDAEFEVKK